MRTLTDAEAAAYRAPFPSPDYQAGALAFPRLVPIRPDHPGAYENRIAIESLKRLELPVLLPWGDADPMLGKLEPELRAIFRNVAPPLISQRGRALHTGRRGRRSCRAHPKMG